MKATTLDLSAIKANHRLFGGRDIHIVEIYEVGPYAVIEYTKGSGDASETWYAPFVDGKMTVYRFAHIETALAYAMAEKRGAPMALHIAVLYAKMIDNPEP